jgi:hypothetical protein
MSIHLEKQYSFAFNEDKGTDSETLDFAKLCVNRKIYGQLQVQIKFSV